MPGYLVEIQQSQVPPTASYNVYATICLLNYFSFLYNK